jgi:hypothetical protein
VENIILANVFQTSESEHALHKVCTAYVMEVRMFIPHPSSCMQKMTVTQNVHCNEANCTGTHSHFVRIMALINDA